MQEIIKGVLSDPAKIQEVLGYIIALVGASLHLIEKIKARQGNLRLESVKEFIKNEAFALAKSNLDNDEKRNELLSRVLRFIPEKERKYLPEKDIIELINMTYHTYVKPNLKKPES